VRVTLYTRCLKTSSKSQSRRENNESGFSKSTQLLPRGPQHFARCGRGRRNRGAAPRRGRGGGIEALTPTWEARKPQQQQTTLQHIVWQHYGRVLRNFMKRSTRSSDQTSYMNSVSRGDRAWYAPPVAEIVRGFEALWWCPRTISINEHKCIVQAPTT